ncbi:MAG: hypothetical protein AB7T38_16640 [Nitrospirales bacterium]
MVGDTREPLSILGFWLVLRHRRRVRSLTGGIRETQEMLNFCADHGITCDIETLKIQEVNEVWQRIFEGGVWFRFVIDMASLQI